MFETVNEYLIETPDGEPYMFLPVRYNEPENIPPQVAEMASGLVFVMYEFKTEEDADMLEQEFEQTFTDRWPEKYSVFSSGEVVIVAIRA
jgi:hypothetical protein